jgi:hypothetical protein
MPKSHVAPTKQFREFSKQPKRYIKQNHLKNISKVYRGFKEQYDISRPEIEFMLFIYDLEFFTIDWVCDQYGQSKKQLPGKILYPLLKREYIYKHFDKLTPKKDVLGQMFRSETKYNYRVRYALAQKGRLMVQRFYNEL